MGRQGEDLACKYLKKHKYKIIERNYTTPFGEADIVAFKDGYTCFIEVKTRETDAFGLPAEAVTREKQRKYRMIAGYYCTMLRREIPVRFDVVSIYEGQVEYFENAFI